MSPRRRLNAAGQENELAFQSRVVGLFRVYGFERIFHAPAGGHLGRVSREQIPEGRGFPDLVAIKGPRLVVAELKASARLCKASNLRPGQWDWLQAFNGVGEAVSARASGWTKASVAPSVEAYLWSPDDWDEIQDIVRGAMTRRRDLDPLVEAGG